MSKNFEPFIGFSTGDPNGIGIEIILKSLSDSNLNSKFKPVVFSNYKLIESQNRIFDSGCQVVHINQIEDATVGFVNVLNINNKSFDLKFGESNRQGGEFSRDSLFHAVDFLKQKKIDALVTGPINKNNIQSKEFDYKGHTDFLADYFHGDSLMFMVSEHLKIALLTEHIPINEIISTITPDLIKKRIEIIHNSLLKDFDVQKPKIAVLSINPHIGDNGVIGTHDNDILIPTISKISKNGIDVNGPFSSDSFFGSNDYKKYDAIVATYHDQGLIPFKTLTFGKGVNYTAGLDVIRTSPDHGTAYNISGKNIANESSFKAAIISALNILKNRSKN